MPEKHELVRVFHDTLRYCEKNEKLMEAIKISVMNTKVFPENFSDETDAHKAGLIQVMKGRTLQTALLLGRKFPGRKISVLNFAASQHPGGGVEHGSRAQEESLCRSSTLYYSLKSREAGEKFYGWHKANCGYKASDTCIYSPNVIICRDDSDELPARLQPEEFMTVDVVTCAAPHIFPNVRITPEELFALHVKRAKNILRVAAYNDVDIFVGGAFGCGAFKNDPYVVARAWHEALKEYGVKFELVVFAIYARSDEESNLRAFSSEFTDKI